MRDVRCSDKHTQALVSAPLVTHEVTGNVGIVVTWVSEDPSAAVDARGIGMRATGGRVA